MASKKKETRIERWLLALSENLMSHGWQVLLGYDDRYRGDELWISMQPPATMAAPGVRVRCGELQIRRTEKGAALALFISAQEALKDLSVAIDGLHRQIRRIDNAKRKFFHRIERMAVHLEATFEARRRSFPVAPFDKLKGLFLEAFPMIGLRGHFREKEGARTDPPVLEHPYRRLAKQAMRYQSCFAAGILAGNAYRAVPHLPGAGFRFAGDALSRLHQVLGENPSAEEADHAIANRVDRSRASPGPSESWRLSELVDDAAAEAWCWGIQTPDCDFIDLPDCDVCDLPDCTF